MLLLPVAFPLLLGYALECVRSAARDPSAAPPAWRLRRRQLLDGLLLGVALLLLALPFALAGALAAHVLAGPLRAGRDPFLATALGDLAAAAGALLTWGLAAILLVPPLVARCAASGRARDLFDVRAGLALVGRRFAGWNLASAAGVTAWFFAAALALTCLGALPGAFYAILVSAHACASLVEDPPAG